MRLGEKFEYNLVTFEFERKTQFSSFIQLGDPPILKALECIINIAIAVTRQTASAPPANPHTIQVVIGSYPSYPSYPLVCTYSSIQSKVCSSANSRPKHAWESTRTFEFFSSSLDQWERHFPSWFGSSGHHDDNKLAITRLLSMSPQPAAPRLFPLVPEPRLNQAEDKEKKNSSSKWRQPVDPPDILCTLARRRKWRQMAMKSSPINLETCRSGTSCLAA
ncbi:hypothetical protein B0J13DRAFT_297660 [Dactylonectria estremocensis]|uniref:Uncharacterized protein n=1 Tax=Dactylonectria estremocensis TaxID=1079267 RepID=A0A9P9F137_9HYPO|nr:hypothetical protein B0J13DRAFT_297660 [Dactylonectria estremocensis]